jgi:hypothetical protein
MHVHSLMELRLNCHAGHLNFNCRKLKQNFFMVLRMLQSHCMRLMWQLFDLYDFARCNCLQMVVSHILPVRFGKCLQAWYSYISFANASQSELRKKCLQQPRQTLVLLMVSLVLLHVTVDDWCFKSGNTAT